MKKSEIEDELLKLEATIKIIATRPKGFEELYHGRRVDRKRFNAITPKLKRTKLMKRTMDTFSFLVEEIKPWAVDAISPKRYDTSEYETRLSLKITEKIEILRVTDSDFQALDDEQKLDLERFVLYRKFVDTFNLFLDYSIQDTQILYDIEMKLTKFNTLSMLAQYNVSGFHDVFSTLKQVEQGITNFAHLNNKKVVIDREYDKAKQPYNQFIDKELLRIRTKNDYRVLPEDSDIIREMKTLTSQPKIPGAHVLSPNIGLISFDEEVTPGMAREFKSLRLELEEIDKQLEAFE